MRVPTSKNLDFAGNSAGKTQSLAASAKIIVGLKIPTLMKNTPEKSVLRAKDVKIVTRFSGTTGTDTPTLRFVTKSKFPTTAHVPPTHQTIVKMVGKDRVWISCECEDFSFRWEYALTQHKASSIIHSNGEPAVIRNPKNIPGVCLHLYKVLSLKSTNDRLLELRDKAK